MHDLETQAPHGDTGVPDEKTKATSAWCFFGVSATIIVVIACTIIHAEYYTVDARYSVGIDSVSGSGLDPSTGLSFNLTLGVTSRSHGAKACINPGMFVEVFYRGVQLAASDAETQKLCAGPRKTAEMPTVARATGVPVGHVLDSLAAELKQGAAVFDFKLHVPARSYGGTDAMTSWLTGCKGSQVGGAAVLCTSPGTAVVD